MKFSHETHLDVIAQTIFDKKGANIFVLDVKNICSITDYFVLAEGTATTHVQAICHAIIEKMQEVGLRPLHIEGLREGEWVVIDFGTTILHLFAPGLRDRYQLEELWRAGKIVNVSIQTHA